MTHQATKAPAKGTPLPKPTKGGPGGTVNPGQPGPSNKAGLAKPKPTPSPKRK